MIGSKDETLKLRLKKMIIEECEKYDVEPEERGEVGVRFSAKSRLELDSIDALQISMGLQYQFGIRLADSKDFRRVVTTINALAEYIQPE